jgi:hypothetical protein
LIKVLRLFASVVLLAMVASACSIRGSSVPSNVQPADFYGANPSLTDVRTLLGDNNWWPGPPSFGVPPLDSSTMPFNEKFHVITRFAHLGTAETFEIDYTLWDSTASATTQMTSIQSAFGTSVSGAKVGDQALYYGSKTSGAAPYGTVTFVRIGQILTTITLTLKDAFPTVAKLGKIAAKVTSRLKDVISGKVHVSPLSSSDEVLLPPAGPDITLLGSLVLPVEAFAVMAGSPSPEALAGILHATGVDGIVFGDYVLDSDTHMEVRAGIFNFTTNQDAAAWVDTLRGTHALDADGIALYYDAGSGQYFSLFSEGTKAALLVCRSTSDAEAASRACEVPLTRVAPAWQLSLTPA